MLYLQYCACHGQTLSQEIKQKKLIPEGLVAVVSGWKGKGIGKLKIIVMTFNMQKTTVNCFKMYNLVLKEQGLYKISNMEIK